MKKMNIINQKLAIALVLSVSICVKCTKKVENRTFRVGLRAIPERLDPRNNDVNIFHYINSNLYYPLFDKTSYGKLQSDFLDMDTTEARDQIFSTFRMCLKEGISFSDGTSIRSSHLENSIRFVHQKDMELPVLESLRAEGFCVDVKLQRGEPKYFDKLSTLESTLLKEEPSFENPAPIGLGPFHIIVMNNEKIILKRSSAQSTKRGIDVLEFLKIATPEDGERLQIHDWNNLWPHLGANAPLPSYIINDWRRFEQSLVRSLMIVTHIKNANLSKKLAYCFDRLTYKKRLGMDLTNIPGFLPKGLTGSRVSFEEIKGTWGFTKEDCRAASKNTKIVPFILFYPTLEAHLRLFLEDVQDSLPIRIGVSTVSVNEAIAKLYSGEELLIATLADTIKGRAAGFFVPFLGDKRVIIQNLIGLDALLRKGATSNDVDESEKYFEIVHRKLLETGAIIPLGQVHSTFYYPKFVKAIPAVDLANGFPRIDQIEVAE